MQKNKPPSSNPDDKKKEGALTEGQSSNSLEVSPPRKQNETTTTSDKPNDDIEVSKLEFAASSNSIPQASDTVKDDIDDDWLIWPGNPS